MSERTCNAVVGMAVPDISAVVDGQFGHSSCSLAIPTELFGDVTEENATEEVGDAADMKACHAMVSTQFGQEAHAALLTDGKCKAVTEKVKGFTISKKGGSILAPVAPFPAVDNALTVAAVSFEECFLLFEGSERVEPFMLAPQNRREHGSRTWAGVHADGQLAYGWGIYWSPNIEGNFSVSIYRSGHDRHAVVHGDPYHPTSFDNECFAEGTPVHLVTYTGWAGNKWVEITKDDRAYVRILKDPRHAACVPIAGKLNVPTTELAQDVATFRDCVALAFDDHNDKVITALHYDMSERTCNAVVGMAVPDISAVVDGQFGHSSCSLAIPTELFGNVTEENATEEVGDAADMKACHAMVSKQYGQGAHAALLTDGKCKAVTEKVKGFAISGNGGSILAPVAPFRHIDLSYAVPYGDCYLMLEGSSEVAPRLYTPQKDKLINGAGCWAQSTESTENFTFDYNSGVYFTAGGGYSIGDYDDESGHMGKLIGDEVHPVGEPLDCLVDGTRAQWRVGDDWADAGRMLVLKDPRHAMCPPARGNLTVPTVELAKGVDSFRDCVAMALDGDGSELVTGVQYNSVDKTCSVAIGEAAAVVDAVEVQSSGISCSVDTLVVMVVVPSEDTPIEELSHEENMTDCYNTVKDQNSEIVEGAMLASDGKCSIVYHKSSAVSRLRRLLRSGESRSRRLLQSGESLFSPITPTKPLATTTTTEAPTTTGLPAPVTCDASRVNLEFSYIQENTLAYCGEATCFVHPNGDAQLAKQQSVRYNLFPMMEELKSQFKSVKMTYAEFCDKNIEPFGQSNADFCYKFFNSLKPYDAEYREWIEDHWERKWPHSSSGMDMLENQLDAIISTVQRANYSTASHDEEGNLNLRIALMLTDKGFHDYGDVREQFPDCKLDGQELCREYQIDSVGCQCVGYEYPSVEQVLDVLSEKRVHPIVLLGEPVDDSVFAAYTSLNVNVAEVSGGELSAVVMTPENGASYGFNSGAVKAAVEALCVHAQSLELD